MNHENIFSSPERFRNFLESASKKAFDWLLYKFERNVLLCSLAYLASITLLYIDNYRILAIIYFAILCSLSKKFIKDQNIYSLVCFVFSCSYFIIEYLQIPKSDFSFIPFLIFVYLVPIMMVIVTRGLSIKLRIFIILITLLVGDLLPATIGVISPYAKVINFVKPWRLILLFVYLLYEDEIERYSFKDFNTWFRIINPVNMLFAAFNRKDLFNPTPSLGRMLRGFILLHFSQIFYRSFFFLNSDLVSKSIYGRLLAYPTFYFYFSAYSCFFFGILLVLGCNLDGPNNLPLLADNPIDRWKRWNVYTSRWYRNILFIPTYKATSNLFLAVMLTFFINGILHFESENRNSIIRLNKDALLNLSTYHIIVAFLLQGLAVYLTFKIPKLFGEKNKRSGWIGVFLTWIILTFIYNIRLS